MSIEQMTFRAVEAPPVTMQVHGADTAMEVFRALEGRELQLEEEKKLYSAACFHLATFLNVVVSIHVPLADCCGGDQAASEPRDILQNPKSGQCSCSCGMKCPLGKTGMEARCTADELRDRLINLTIKFAPDS